jgi:ribosomal protein S27AE
MGHSTFIYFTIVGLLTIISNKEAGEKLIEKLNSFCPDCGLPGLPCLVCGEASKVAKQVSWECVKCEFSEVRNRPDGKSVIEPEECENCNP